ncbi:mCG1050960 [Mus musculus]|nr:mCG1050960 [Mus musculus]
MISDYEERLPQQEPADRTSKQFLKWLR